MTFRSAPTARSSRPAAWTASSASGGWPTASRWRPSPPKGCQSQPNKRRKRRASRGECIVHGAGSGSNPSNTGEQFMLTILGERHHDFCDGVTRRSFLRIGGLALGGLSLPQILRGQEQSGARRPAHKSVIMIFLAGGPPHQDMWDLKPDAPSEVRGELRPIRTNVPGIEICELFPRMAKIMDKLAVIRSMVGANG